MNLKNSLKFLFATTLIVLALSFQFVAPVFKGKAEATTNSTVSITNGNFNQSPTSYYLDDSPNGWTKIYSTSPVTEGIINTNPDKFDSYKSTYYLKNSDNPGTMNNDENDTKILMINARNSSSETTPHSQGYRSSSLTLNPYTYYKFSILVKTEVGAFASVYLTGLGETYDRQFEQITSTKWKEFKFYISTGSTNQTINFELWLGTRNNQTSPYAVFFDNLTGETMSKDRFDQEIAGGENTYTKISQIPANYVDGLITNSDFETQNLSGWTAINPFPANTYHQVVNTNSDFLSGNGFTNLGGDGIKGSYALWLASKNKPNASFGYRSNEIELSIFEVYKINVNAKVQEGTTARIVLRESDDVKLIYEKHGLTYEPNKVELIFSTNGSSNFLNGYQTYSLYIKGHSLYNTHFTVELWLGTDDEPSAGSVLFDNITVEKITGTEFSNATESGTVKKLNLQTSSNSTNLPNGTFNYGVATDPNNIFPIKPDNWTSKVENETKNVFGIINTNNAIYEANKSKFGDISNPNNPEGFSSDTETETNNILMMWNKGLSYQSLTSDSVSVSANSYYKLTFYFKTASTLNPQLNFNLSVLDQNDVKVFEQENINVVSWKDWEKYTMTIKVGNNTTSLKVCFSLGTESNKTQGYLFIDNVELKQSSSTTDEEFNTLASIQKSDSKDTVLDLTNALMNVRLLPNEEGIYPSVAFSGSLESGSQLPGSQPIADSGIVDGVSNLFDMNNSPENKNAIKNLMFIRNFAQAKYSLTAKANTSLEANKIYKLSIYLRIKPLSINNSSFVATYSLEGLEDAVLTNITTEEWQEYKIIVNSTAYTQVKLKFTLETKKTAGAILFIDNFTLTELSKEEYSQLVASYENKDGEDYEQIRQTTLIIGSTDVEEEPEKPTEEENQTEFSWILIPSIITAVALIIAVIGFSLRRIKFKKWQRKQVTQYDRNKTLYRDVLRKEAEERRDQELKQLNLELNEIEKEIQELEEQNKEKLAQRRKEKGGAIDKQAEKEFKLYASKRTALENKKEKLLQKISDVNSAEYLLGLQRKITIEKTKNLKK